MRNTATWQDSCNVRRNHSNFVGNENHNHDMTATFKSAAAMASSRQGPFHDFYQGLLTKGMKPAMARLTLARKIAAITLMAITLILWKKGAHFDAERLKRQAA